ncbi:hypothetical protein D3C71_1269680 [compost metagenome]
MLAEGFEHFTDDDLFGRDPFQRGDLALQRLQLRGADISRCLRQRALYRGPDPR